jgi:hypothetical protein
MSTEKKELIVVKQLPVIEERLKSIKEQIQTRTKEALALECTEETVKEIKKVRTELTNGFKELEARRKEVKSKIMAPYDQFEAVYRDCVTNVYAPADTELKSRIDEVEDAVKNEKRTEVAAYFDEYAKSNGIDFLTFDRADIKVDLSTSAKSLKTAAANFIDRIVEGLALIDTQEHKEEILVEFKVSLNAATAITSVTQRHEAIEAERKRKEEARIAREEREAAERKTEEAATQSADTASLAPPTVGGSDPEAEHVTSESETAPAEDIKKVEFTVYGTLKKLTALKEFLVEGEYRYESR